MNVWNFSSIFVTSADFRAVMYGPTGSWWTQYIKLGSMDPSKPANCALVYSDKRE